MKRLLPFAIVATLFSGTAISVQPLESGEIEKIADVQLTGQLRTLPLGRS